MTTQTTRLATLLATSMLLLAPVGAGAQSSLEGYSGPGGQEQSQVVAGTGNDPGSGDQSPASTSATDLPFTGLDLALVSGAGMVLLGLGLGLRSLGTRPVRPGKPVPVRTREPVA